MARTKTVQRSSSVTRALSDTLSQQPKETETQLAEQPEANEPATASTKTPVTNLPATENAFLAETIKTPASESPVEQETNDDELSAARVETTTGTQTTSAATTIITSVMTSTVTQPTLLTAAGSMASRAGGQGSAGTLNRPAAHASTQQDKLTMGTTATLLSALQWIMTIVNRLETRINDVEAAQVPSHEQQSTTLPISTTTRSPDTAEAAVTTSVKRMTAAVEAQLHMMTSSESQATEAVTPTVTNLAMDAPPQNVVPGLEQPLVALLETINATNPTAATVAKWGTAARARPAVPPGPGDGDGGGGGSSDDSDYSSRSEDNDNSSADDLCGRRPTTKTWTRRRA
ncbi:hypothetical protein L917_08663 [Phytophthora nicotianae]|uniref:Uncharacterized protein n=1 Tax=Phytophthora nicotianae TaxID=4792 RepID=W2L6Q4_PHYNI|nr:hypothetical protein L917_08663 [Phytophthora nicotianae]